MYNSTSIDMHDNFDKALYVISYVLYSGMGMHYPRYYKNTAVYVTGPDALHFIFSILTWSTIYCFGHAACVYM